MPPPNLLLLPQEQTPDECRLITALLALGGAGITQELRHFLVGDLWGGTRQVFYFGLNMLALV